MRLRAAIFAAVMLLCAAPAFSQSCAMCYGSAKSTSKVTFALDEGGFFTVAGEGYSGGILIYALSCKTEK